MSADAQLSNESVPESRRARPGYIWQCGACGKKAVDCFGLVGWRSAGWDESCMLNAFQTPIVNVETGADQKRIVLP